ncbi:hypothetical protein QE152_g27742 [Popillia japonica]|uniref:Polyprotein n=1 Tax=Popillia japonica TaxID=7064 RepID=A0AAW1JTV7_POPJA
MSGIDRSEQMMSSWVRTDLINTVFVPDLDINLFFLSTVLDKHFEKMMIDKNKCELLDKNGKVVAIAERLLKLYTMKFKIRKQECEIQYSQVNVVLSLKEWHQKLCHINFDQVEKAWIDSTDFSNSITDRQDHTVPGNKVSCTSPKTYAQLTPVSVEEQSNNFIHVNEILNTDHVVPNINIISNIRIVSPTQDTISDEILPSSSPETNNDDPQDKDYEIDFSCLCYGPNYRYFTVISKLRIKEQVFDIMRPDEIAFEAKKDLLIAHVGESYLKKHRRDGII